MRITLLLALVLVVFSCNSKPLQNQIVGKWEMKIVMDGTANMTDQHNPNKDRWIEFKADGTFESGGTPYGSNTGKFEIDEENRILNIYSDTENDDSDWAINIDEDFMTWQGRGSLREMEFKLTHQRIK